MELNVCHRMEEVATIVKQIVIGKLMTDEFVETELSIYLMNNVTTTISPTETAVMTSASEKFLSVRSARHQVRSIVASKRPLLSRSQAVIRDGSATIVSSMAMAIVNED